MTPARGPGPDRGQGGYTIAAMLTALVVLTLLGTIAYRNTRTDISHAKRAQVGLRAKFAAESAVNWALAELARPRGDLVPFTKATHDPTGATPLSAVLSSGAIQGRKLLPSQVNSVYAGGAVQSDPRGWLYCLTNNEAASVSGLAPEKLAFKVWYPESPPNSIRITAMGVAGKDSMQVEFIGTFQNTFVPLP